MGFQTSRRNFLRGSLMMAAGGVLAACAPAAAPSGSTQPSSGGAPAQETVALRWDTFRGIGTGWNEERITTFQEMNPNVTVELRPLAGSSQQDNYAKMYAAFAANDLGEVIAFDPSHYQFDRAISKSIIMPIDELVQSDGTDLSEWYELFMGLQYSQGKLYGLPSWGWAGQDSLVTNAAHFKEAGVELPDPVGHDTSMETIGEWARSFNQEGVRFGFNFPNSESAVSVLCRAFNGFFINEEGTKCLVLDDAGSQESLRWLYDIAVTDKVMPAPGSIENAESAQVEGKITMNWGGSLNVRNFKRNIEAGNVAPEVAEPWQILFPTREDGKFPSQLRGGTWNIRQGTEHATEAYAFLKHIAGKEGSVGFNLVGGNFAAVRPDVVAALIEADPVHEWFIPNLENGIPARAPANSRGREYTDAITQYMQLLTDPNQTVAFEQGLQDLHDAVQQVLDMEPA